MHEYYGENATKEEKLLAFKARLKHDREMADQHLLKFNYWCDRVAESTAQITKEEGNFFVNLSGFSLLCGCGIIVSILYFMTTL